MKKTSPVSIVLAVLQLVGSTLALLVSGGLQFIFVLFGGVDNLDTGMLLLVLRFLVYIIAAISVLVRRPWAVWIACLAGTIGVLTGITVLMKSGLQQPGLAYLAFHAMYLSWFTFQLIQNKKDEAEQSHAEATSTTAPSAVSEASDA